MVILSKLTRTVLRASDRQNLNTETIYVTIDLESFGLGWKMDVFQGAVIASALILMGVLVFSSLYAYNSFLAVVGIGLLIALSGAILVGFIRYSEEAPNEVPESLKN